MQRELDHLGGTGFPGVNLAHDGNELRLIETVYIRFIPYQSFTIECIEFQLVSCQHSLLLSHEVDLMWVVFHQLC